MSSVSTDIGIRSLYNKISLSRMFAVAHERRALAELDAAQLKDLGLTHSEALEEARRPFWDVPQHWRKS